jgi:hypothetical protein
LLTYSSRFLIHRSFEAGIASLIAPPRFET